MNIILPPHRLKSKEVVSLTEQLKSDIEGMKNLLDKQKFVNGRTGLAIAHCQVSRDPHKLFVTTSGLIVINPEILDKSEPYTAKEICLSFPFRDLKKVKRYNLIKVKFLNQYLTQVIETVSGVQAQIFQHEIEHFDGRSIYS